VLTNPVDRFRVVGLVEGVSFLVLLGIAMPLKYLAGMPEAVRVVGWVHGVLFMAYLAAVADVTLAMRWSPRQVLAALVAGVVPFGPFVHDAWMRRQQGTVEARPAVDLPG
jgi:integral membrane protein